MPITSGRMIRLLNAALDWRQTAEHQRELILKEIAGVKHGLATASQALNNISLLCDPQGLLRDPAGSVQALAEERQHWKTNIKRVEHNAEVQRRRRRLKQQQDTTIFNAQGQAKANARVTSDGFVISQEQAKVQGERELPARTVAKPGVRALPESDDFAPEHLELEVRKEIDEFVNRKGKKS